MWRHLVCLALLLSEPDSAYRCLRDRGARRDKSSIPFRPSGVWRLGRLRRLFRRLQVFPRRARRPADWSRQGWRNFVKHQDQRDQDGGVSRPTDDSKDEPPGTRLLRVRRGELVLSCQGSRARHASLLEEFSKPTVALRRTSGKRTAARKRPIRHLPSWPCHGILLRFFARRNRYRTALV